MNFRLTAKDVRFILFILMILLFTFTKSFSATRTASVSGNWSSTATWGGSAVPTSADVVIINTNITVTVDGTYTCTSITMNAPSTGQTNTINVNSGNLTTGIITMNGSNSIRCNIINITTGTLTLNSSPSVATLQGGKINLTDNGVINFGRNGNSNLLLNCTAGTVNYLRAGAQTLNIGTYNNIKLGGTSSKTFTTGTTTINGILRMEGTATVTVTGTLTFGANTGIVYNKTTHTTGTEWPAPFNGSGGVTIESGTVTLGANESLGTDDPLTINSGATLSTSGSNFSLTLGGNFTNSGTFTANASNIIITNTGATQTIDGFTTTGTVSMTKTSGTATFNGNVNAGTFTLNGNGGTLNFGDGNTHTFTGAFTITNGILNLGSSIVNIAGAVSKTGGTLNINTSTVNYNSSSAQDIFAADYYNLSLSNTGTKTVTSTTNVINELDINAGTLVTGGFLTLKSTSIGTARVGTNAGTITGDVIVERFIPGGSNKRKWRFLSSPVNVSGSIAISQYIDDILITAPAGSAAGFDVNPFSPTNVASFRTYDEAVSGVSNNGWTDPTDVTNTIESGIGAEVFVRGTRTLADPYLNWTTPDDVTIDFVGALNSGTISPAITYTPSVGGATTSDGFNLVGNPYASTIDFTHNGLTKTNIDNKFWCYNPNTGSYGVYDMDLNDSTNSITRYISSGQAFFVRANAVSPALSFTEAIKCAAPGNNYFKGNQSKATHAIIHVKVSNDSTYADEALVVLDETASCFSGDTHDAGKLFNDALNVYTLSDDNVNLTINALPFIKNVDTIKLAVYSYNGYNVMTTEHRLEFTGIENFDPSKHIYLEDSYTNTITNLAHTNSYTFNITSDNTSWGKNRFKLLFSTNALGISSTKSNEKIELYPNPASSEINLKFSSVISSEQFKYQIIDIYGRVIAEDISEVQNQNTKININSIPSGQYFINIISETNTSILRFVK